MLALRTYFIIRPVHVSCVHGQYMKCIRLRCSLYRTSLLIFLRVPCMGPQCWHLLSFGRHGLGGLFSTRVVRDIRHTRLHCRLDISNLPSCCLGISRIQWPPETCISWMVNKCINYSYMFMYLMEIKLHHACKHSQTHTVQCLFLIKGASSYKYQVKDFNIGKWRQNSTTSN